MTESSAAKRSSPIIDAPFGASTICARLAALAAIGAAGAAYQALVARELAVGLFGLWLALVGIFALANISFGLGAALAQARRCALSARQDWAALGGGVLVSLAFLAHLAPGRVQPFAVVAAICAVLGVLALFGRGYALIFAASAESYGAATASAASLLGLAAGLLASGPLGTRLGVNAALAALGAALILFGAGLAWPLALALFAFPSIWTRLDVAIEHTRPAVIDCNFRCSSDWLRHATTPLYGGWTPYSRLDIYANKDRDRLIGAYNYYVHWLFSPVRLGAPVWPIILHPTDRILEICASAGYDQVLMPRFVDSRNIDFVEIDPGVVGYFQAHPKLNNGLYSHFRVFAMDGRAYLDRYRGTPYDVILVGSGDSPSRSFLGFDTTKAHLLTREGVQAAMRALGPHGIALFMPRDESAAENIMLILNHEAIPHRMNFIKAPIRWNEAGTKTGHPEISDEPIVEYQIYASRDSIRLEEAVERIRYFTDAARKGPIVPPDLDMPWDQLRKTLAMRRSKVSVRKKPLIASQLITPKRWAATHDPDADFTTDDRPYGLAASGAHWRPWARAVTAALTAGLIFVVLFLRRRSTGRGGYFTLIGAAYILTQMAVISAWQSCFGDPLKTMSVIFLIWSLGAAAGALASQKLAPRPFTAGTLLIAAAFYAWWGLSAIPLTDPRRAHQAATAAALVLPVSFVCGIFFPQGCAGLTRDLCLEALLWDGLGAALGFPLYFAVSIAWGVSFCVPIAAAAYAAALLFCDGQRARETL